MRILSGKVTNATWDEIRKLNILKRYLEKNFKIKYTELPKVFESLGFSLPLEIINCEEAYHEIRLETLGGDIVSFYIGDIRPYPEIFVNGVLYGVCSKNMKLESLCCHSKYEVDF